MGIGSGWPASQSGEERVLSQVGAVPGPLCVLDVGANRGQFAQLALETLPMERTTIHCFEPSATAFTALSGLLARNPSIRLHQTAIGAERGHATLWSDAAGSSLSSLSRRDVSHCGMRFDCHEQVTVRTIDDFCEESQLERLHLVKLDVEGHELSAMRGAARMLQSGRIDVITFEFGGCHIDTRTFFRDFWIFLNGMHMRIARITPSGFLSAINQYEEALEQFRTTNFVAYRPNVLAAALSRGEAN